MATVYSTETGDSRSGIYNGTLGLGTTYKIFNDALASNRAAVIPKDFWDLHPWNRLIEKRGRANVMRAGIDLFNLYSTLIAADNDFGETFEVSRKDRTYVQALEEEIYEAANDLGRRIFQDIAIDYVRHSRPDASAIVGDKESEKAWRVAFGIPQGYIPQHVLEVAVGENQKPVIEQVWGIATDGRLEDIEHYVRMLQYARNKRPELFVQDAIVTLLVPANSDISKLDNSEREVLGISVVELPILRSQMRDFGYAMLLDETPTEDSATASETKRRIAADRDRSPVQNYKDGTL